MRIHNISGQGIRPWNNTGCELWRHRRTL